MKILLLIVIGVIECTEYGKGYSYMYFETREGSFENYGIVGSQKYNPDQKCSFDDRDCKEKEYKNLVGLGKFDRDDIYRPCPLDDWQCIRKFFANNSKCKPSYGPIPDPLKLERITQYYPFANLTAIQTKFTATGLANSKVTELYVNKETGNLVFTINFRDLNETSPQAYFRYKRTGKESIILVDYTTILYGSGTFTAVIPKIPHLRLDLAEVHADIDNAVPPFVVGPAAFNSTDPDVVAAFVKFSSNIPTAIREAFLFKSQFYIALFIQENICDFGLKIISV